MTFVAYPNIVARSRNQSYRVEISGTSIENYFRDQSDFVYRLYHFDQLVWQWPTCKDKGGVGHLDDYPHEAWVSNERWVVVRTHGWFYAGLLTFSPDGEIVLRGLHRQLIETDPPGFLDSEPSNYMGDSSAGPFWSRAAFAYFTEAADRPIWIMRTWWGFRVAIDLKQGEFLNSASLDEECLRRSEIAWVHDTLKAGIGILEKEGERNPEHCDFSIVNPVMTAAYQAGWLQAIDTVPYLQRLESMLSYPTIGSRSVCWAQVIRLSIRQLAKLSLLRLDQEPAWLPHYGFRLRGEPAGENEYDGSSFPLPTNGKGRDARKLELGLSQHETLRRLGSPDFMERESWEYDFFSPKMTVRIFWHDSRFLELPSHKSQPTEVEHTLRIVRIEQCEPQWKQITQRDDHVIG